MKISRLLYVAVTVCILLLSYSCAEEYDLEKLDGDISFGGDSLILPIGSTDSLTLTKFFDPSSIEQMKINDNGEYVIEFADDFGQEVIMSNYLGDMSIDGFSETFILKPVVTNNIAGMDQYMENLLPGVPADDFKDQWALLPEDQKTAKMDALPDDWNDLVNQGLESSSLYAARMSETQSDEVIYEIALEDEDYNKQVLFSFDFEEARKSGLIDMDTIEFESSVLLPNMELNITNEGVASNIPEKMKVNFDLDIPVRYTIREQHLLKPNKKTDHQTVALSGTVDPTTGKVEFPKLHIEKVAFDVVRGQEFRFVDEFLMHSFVLVMPKTDVVEIVGTEININVGIDFCSEIPPVSKLVPQNIVGLVDIEMTPMLSNIDLSTLPEFMRSEDVVLDFYNPFIITDLKSNAGVPFLVDISISPVFEAEAGEYNLFACLEAPLSYDPEVFDTEYYLISNYDKEGEYENYEWVEKDVAKLVERIPDTMQIEIIPHSDTNSAEKHYINCSASYDVSGDFAFVLPMSFGAGLNMHVTQQMDMSSMNIARILETTSISLLGSMTSTFPVNIALQVYFVDAAGEKIDLDINTQEVSCVDEIGIPKVTPMNITIKSAKLDREISGLVLDFALLGAENADMEGVILSEDNYVIADMKLGVPGGLTIDLGDISSGEML